LRILKVELRLLKLLDFIKDLWLRVNLEEFSSWVLYKYFLGTLKKDQYFNPVLYFKSILRAIKEFYGRKFSILEYPYLHWWTVDWKCKVEKVYIQDSKHQVLRQKLTYGRFQELYRKGFPCLTDILCRIFEFMRYQNLQFSKSNLLKS